MFKFLVIILITVSKIYAYEDEYLNEKFKSCEVSKKSVECFKYRVVKYLMQFTTQDYILKNGRNFENRLGPFKLVRIDFIDGTNESVKAFGELRQFNDDSEFEKVLKFLKRALSTVLQSFALKVPLPNDQKSVIIVDEDEEDDSFNEIGRHAGSDARKFHHKKKKLYILFPLLVMLKLFKVKVLLVVILLGVVIIKKILLGGVLIVPQILNSIKACKPPPVVHGHEAYSGAEYADFVNPYAASNNYNLAQGYGHGGYGAGGYGGGYGNAGAGVGGAYERVYNAHKPAPS